MKGKTFLGVQGRNKPVVLALSVLFVLSLVIMTCVSVYTEQQTQLDQQRIADTGALRALSQQIAQQTTAATAGKKEAFLLLKETRNVFDTRLQALQQAPLSAFPLLNDPADPSLQQIAALETTWSASKLEIKRVLSSENTVLSLHNVVKALIETMPQLQVEYDEIVEQLLAAGISAQQIAIAQRQPLLAEQITRNIRNLLAGEEDAALVAERLQQTVKRFGQTITGMLEGSVAMNISRITHEPAIDRLAEVADLFGFVDSSVREILDATATLSMVRSAVAQIQTDAQQLLQQASVLANRFTASTTYRFTGQLLFFGAGLLALLALVCIAVVSIGETRRQLAAARAENDVKQAAVLRLLQEMGRLADGDLTVKVTAAEAFTEAMATAVNAFIERLRALVNTINQTAAKVDAAAQITQASTQQLVEAAKRQANDISATTAAATQLAEAIGQVYTDATGAADTAHQAVKTTDHSTQRVQSALQSAHKMQAQVQNMTQSLTNLGEAIQTFSHAVAAISEQVDQANLLALNATIQTAQVTVVSEASQPIAAAVTDIQHLLAHINTATQAIAPLIDTWQANAHETVTALEQITVGMANHAQQIQGIDTNVTGMKTIANTLADRIDAIVRATQTQTATATQITQRLIAIGRNTLQASADTDLVKGTDTPLTNVVLEMRRSVSGYRLATPEH